MAATVDLMRWTQLETPRGSFGLRLHGRPGDDGRLVVCVHGFPDDASTWDGLAEALVSAGFQVAAMNLRGYAPSPLEGALGLDGLVADVLSVIDTLSPDAPVYLVGHDYGAQLAYPSMARAPHRFRRVVLLSGAHPVMVQRNARRSLRQLWASRYIVFFQLGRRADHRVAADDFAYVDRLWRRWSPGFQLSATHRAHVKGTLRASMPGPVAMYRAGGFSVPPEPIPVPTLHITGADDGCAMPFLGEGQDSLFTGEYESETWDGVGHDPHLEQPRRTAAAVISWIRT